MVSTLLLDQSFQPVTVISWQDAIIKFVLGKVEIVEEYNDKFIRSTNLILKMPAVVRLVNKFRKNKEKIRYSKQNIFARDRWTCQYCGQSHTVGNLTVDHVLPRSQGGITCWENVTTACKDCNARKGNKTPQQAGMRLSRQPFKPTWIPLLRLKLSEEHIPASWKTYCDF